MAGKRVGGREETLGNTDHSAPSKDERNAAEVGRGCPQGTRGFFSGEKSVLERKQERHEGGKKEYSTTRL